MRFLCDIVYCIIILRLNVLSDGMSSMPCAGFVYNAKDMSNSYFVFFFKYIFYLCCCYLSNGAIVTRMKINDHIMRKSFYQWIVVLRRITAYNMMDGAAADRGVIAAGIWYTFIWSWFQNRRSFCVICIYIHMIV